MSFGDVSTPAGLGKLNEHLKSHSYVQGYEPTLLDTSTFEAIKAAPGSSHPYALRWYNHIKSFGDARKKFPVASAAAANNNANSNSAPAAADDDDVDLFASDEEEDAEAAKIREARLQAYADKKSQKGPGPVAKSSVVLDVKPWDDETDMQEMEKRVRTIEMDGLVWGASKLVPVGYGIKKLQIMCVVEDEKVSIDLLTEQIQEFEDIVQSVDVAAFNKI